jgi:hypothetical protein
MQMHIHSHRMILIHAHFDVRLCAVCGVRCAVCGIRILAVCGSRAHAAVSSSAAVCDSVRGIVRLSGSAHGSVQLSCGAAVCGNVTVCIFSNKFKAYSYE